MKLQQDNSVFNMGDTSIRVKQVIDVNKIILKQLCEFTEKKQVWGRNSLAQENFYRSFIDEIIKIETDDGISLFSDFSRDRDYTPPKDKIGFRGRTLTNSIVKNGFVDSQRNLSEVGQNYALSSIKIADPIESLLGLHEDNLVYLRQYLKLRIYDSSGQSFFYVFRFAIKFLTIFDKVPKDDFLKIIASIRPTQSTSELNEIIEKYGDVYNNNMLFNQYYEMMFTHTIVPQKEIEEVQTMFNSKNFSDDNFKRFFPNRDSNDTSLLYKEYVLALINLVNNQNEENLKLVKELSRKDKIKKAFGNGRIPFTFTNNVNPSDFFQNNHDNPLLSKDHYQIYLVFIFSKRNDLIREYSDMARRAFQITGIINFENGIAALNNKWLFKNLLSTINNKFSLQGVENYSDYEENLDSVWFKDLTLIEIFSITEEERANILSSICTEFNIAANNINDIQKIIDDNHEQEYRQFIEKYFPKEKVISILKSIADRDDQSVFDNVTDSATIPTIYEYILTIAWYHISKEKDFSVSKSFQVSLDGNKLPLTHRGGGAGDIEILSESYSLLIEATLMDANTQKRGELEPVIRHATNFAIEQSKDTTTLFIANQLDKNVLNIFRATQFIELNGTLDSKSIVNGLTIFGLTTWEVINILEKDKSATDILSVINASRDSTPVKITNNWRDSIINTILNE